MQFCLAESIHMERNGRKGRSGTYSSTGLFQMNAFYQTLRAKLILLLNALESLENRLIACGFPPSQQQNQRRRMDGINES
jgi:hypothetical protein